jgi:hypothetical protein
MPCWKKPVNDWNYAAPRTSATRVTLRKKQLPPMQPGPIVNWDILRHVPFFSMRVATSSMTNHTLRLRNRGGRAPLFRGVNTPAIKNER